MSELRVSGLRKSFDGHAVLHGIDLTVESGSLLALLGPSGSGKTTLLRLLCGFEHADGGTVEIDGRRIVGEGLHVPSEQRRIGYVAQEGALFPHLSVAGNIVFGLPHSQRRARYRVDELLELVGLPSAYGDRPPQTLSGGQQQRVALARALAPAPTLVMLDEPFSSLDAGLRIETREAVSNALVATGATAVLVTHDQSEALSLGQQVAVLWHGKLAQIATPEMLYRQPISQELAAFVGEAVMLPGVVAGNRVRCELGLLTLIAPVKPGPVQVMIRPEQIRVMPATSLSQAETGGAGGFAAVVEKLTYYGHDASVKLKLTSGACAVQVRVAGYLSPRVGETVTLVVEGDVFAYATT